LRTLDDILKLKVKRKYKNKKKARRKLTPEEKFIENTKYIMKVIKRGDYNPNYLQHKMKAESAIKAGYLDKELNIIREV
jgi:hypothetical protein